MTTRFFKVGGAVRDELMGLKPKDIDFAVECESFDTMREEILKRGGKIFVETPAFLTIRAKMEMGFGEVKRMETADFVLCRKDSATSDGRRPDFVTPGTILDDLARRDFTCNAIAIDLSTGELVDPHEGQRDIKWRIIRCVGNPADRMKEDALRAFRAVRFSIVKDFRICEFAAGVIECMTPDRFGSVSTERIREELLKMFHADTVGSCRLLTNRFPFLMQTAIERGIWFEPTTRAK